MKNLLRSNFTTIIWLFAIVLFAYITANAYKYKYKTDQTIAVTGLAEKEFASDQIIWNGNYSRNAFDLKDAYIKIKSDELTIKNYLVQKGVKATEIVFSSVNINKNFNNITDAEGRVTSTVFNGYTLIQHVTVDSKNINLVEKVSREVTELIQSGIEFNSSSPEYFYTKLANLKLELLGKASKDAHDRAATIADKSDQSLGSLKISKMGVFQILGQNSTEDFSNGGTFNTSSRVKKASITIKSEFFIR